MCDGVWVLFEGTELHSLWNNEDDLTDFMTDENWLDDPEYSYRWIRIEDS
jgi:SOS response regulatory protein OraA/RecX